MGLLSLLGKTALTIAKNLDKIDDVSDFANIIPDKINQVKNVAEKANDLMLQHRINKYNKEHNQHIELNKQIAELDASLEGMDYQDAIQVTDEHKLAITYAIPPQYDKMMHIGNNVFSVSLNNKCGIIDINNQTIIPFEYDYIDACDYDGSDSYIFPVQKNEKWGFINIKNETIIDFTYKDAWYFQQELAPVAISTEDEKDYLYGYIDKSGKFILSPKYDSARPFNKTGCATVGMYDETKGKIKYGVINKVGGIVVNCRYDSIIYEDDYIIGINGLYNSDFYDYNGVPMTPTGEMKERDAEIKDEKNMLEQSVICKQNKNVKNKIIPYFNSKLICGYFIQTDEGSFCKIEPIFEAAYNANKFGYARVKYNGLYGVINLNE